MGQKIKSKSFEEKKIEEELKTIDEAKARA